MAREARKRGHALSDASATAYFAGRHGTPDDATIAAFSEVLRIPESEIRKAAGVTAVGEPWIPPQSSRYLRDDQRAALEQLISTMVEREEGGGAHADRAAPKNPPAPGPAHQPGNVRNLPTAASKTPTEPSVSKRRRRQDEAAEASQDDGGMDPL